MSLLLEMWIFEALLAKIYATATQLAYLVKALKAHTFVLPVEGSAARKGEAAPASEKEEGMNLLNNLSQFSS